MRDKKHDEFSRNKRIVFFCTFNFVVLKPRICDNKSSRDPVDAGTAGRVLPELADGGGGGGGGVLPKSAGSGGGGGGGGTPPPLV